MNILLEVGRSNKTLLESSNSSRSLNFRKNYNIDKLLF